MDTIYSDFVYLYPVLHGGKTESSQLTTNPLLNKCRKEIVDYKLSIIIVFAQKSNTMYGSMDNDIWEASVSDDVTCLFFPRIRFVFVFGSSFNSYKTTNVNCIFFKLYITGYSVHFILIVVMDVTECSFKVYRSTVNCTRSSVYACTLSIVRKLYVQFRRRDFLLPF